MSNDIQKYRYLIETIILDESFKDAERLFTDVSGNQKEVSSYIALFKELSKRNKIQGMEKDISRWIKSGWVEFKEFVDSKKDVQSKSEVRSVQKKDSIQVYKDEEKVVVIPLTKEASIHYGRNTQWCTAATKSENHFTTYFYINRITLFYVLFKNGDKYACAFHPSKPDTIECFDQLDKSMTYDEFSDSTGITKNDIHGWYSSNKGVIMKAQDVNNLDEEVQIELVKDDANNIKRIKNPSEAVQLAAVQKQGHSIEYIINKGITPSETVQLAAVKQTGYAIEHIDNPSEAVQLAAIERNGLAIEYIDNPSEQVQLAAVEQNSIAIRVIINRGITPSEAAQLAVVQKDGEVIEYIINKGIKPSEAVQLAAVQKR